MFVVFLCSGFSSPLSPLLGFIMFSIICISLWCYADELKTLLRTAVIQDGSYAVCLSLWVGGFICGVCFVIIYSSYLLFVPREGCALWLWHFLGTFTYIFGPVYCLVVVFDGSRLVLWPTHWRINSWLPLLFVVLVTYRMWLQSPVTNYFFLLSCLILH